MNSCYFSFRGGLHLFIMTASVLILTAACTKTLKTERTDVRSPERQVAPASPEPDDSSPAASPPGAVPQQAPSPSVLPPPASPKKVEPPPDIAPTPCIKRWVADPQVTIDAPKIFENELRWTAQALKKGEVRSLTNTVELQGNFSIRVEFNHFTAGGRGAFFRIKLEDQTNPRYFAWAMVGNHSASSGLGPMLMTGVTNNGQMDEAKNATLGSRSQANGIFTLTKVGKTLTVTAATVDGKIEHQTPSTSFFSDARYSLKLEAGNNSNLASLGNPSRISFAKLQIKDGGGAVLSGSDAFTCDSFAP